MARENKALTPTVGPSGPVISRRDGVSGHSTPSIQGENTPTLYGHDAVPSVLHIQEEDAIP